MPRDIYALILAGGSGERFWPMSRNTRPKQLLHLFSETTLLEDTLKRLDGFVPPERTLILTNREQEPMVRKLLPQYENILAEPAKRDTAAAIALGAAWVSVQDAFATMVVLPADHLIKDHEAFRGTLKRAVNAARETGDLVTIGITPTWACPSFGYLETGKPVKLRDGSDDGKIHEVVRFREKPNADLAEQFIRQPNFRWNAGMFVWEVTSIIKEFNRNAPALAGFVCQAHESKDIKKTIEERFEKLPKISIDYAIMEKAGRVLMVEADFDWDDVGTWAAVAKYFPEDDGGNRANTAVSSLSSKHNVVFSQDKLHVALLGVNDLIVVQTGDAILIASRHQADAVKKIVAGLPPELQ